MFQKKNHYNTLRTLLKTVLIIQSIFIITKLNKTENEFIVFNKSRFSLLSKLVNNKLIIGHDFDSLTPSKHRIIEDYTVGSSINTIEETSLKFIYQLNAEKLMVVDSLGIYQVKSFKPDYVLIRQSPKINLNRLIDSIQPKQIIADGSNYKSYVERWNDICKKRKVPFHQTSKEGAYIIKY